ncbi:TPA: hypothetical protein QDB28_005693 [Burkholderia vietnamiensis]|nr:hypothetical protein [Burkholderia vietnamiensis]
MAREIPVKASTPHSVVEGDDLYFKHATHGVATGKVVAVGAHGVQIKHDSSAEPLKVVWEHVLGHKARAQRRFVVVDRGEDGSIAEDESGKRVYIAGKLSGESQPMAKSFEPAGSATRDELEAVQLVALEAARMVAEQTALIQSLVVQTQRNEALLLALLAKFGIQPDTPGAV